MKNLAANLRSPVIISSILVLPLMILELMFNAVNRLTAIDLKYALDMAILFGILWLLPLAFVAILMPVVRNWRAGKSLWANPIELLLRLAVLIVIAAIWAGISMDQFPCFIGIPNCD